MNENAKHAARKPIKKKGNPALRAAAAVLIIIASAAVFAGAAFAGFYFMNGADRIKSETKPDNPEVAEELRVPSEAELANGAIPDIYRADMNRVYSVNAPTEASVIDTLRENTDKCLSEMKSESGAGNSVVYTLGDDILRIDVPRGFNGFDYDRSYYFNNGVLYYAEICFEEYYNRLYFNNNSLFRYRAEDGGVVDNAFGGLYYDNIGKFAYNEAYAFYDYRKGVKGVR